MAKKNKKQGGSLQDQLRKAGLVSDKQLRKAQKGLHRKEVREQQGEVNQEKAAAESALQVKAASDREKNQARDKIAMEKAIDAQVKQLIEQHGQRQPGDIAYNFSDHNKIKKIYISEENKQQLNKGFLAIVKARDAYELIPEPVARKIIQRREDVILYLYEKSTEVVEEDDPYKDFPIPDDLEW